MTRLEAQATLRAAYPDKDICITVKVWYMRHKASKGFLPSFQVSLLPGHDNPCDQYDGMTLAIAVENALCGPIVDTETEDFVTEAARVASSGDYPTMAGDPPNGPPSALDVERAEMASRGLIPLA